MTVKIDADTSSGLQLESDTSGIIDIQSGGTTKMTIGTTIDIQGNELVLDADADSSISCAVDDKILFKSAGADRFRIDPASASGVTRMFSPDEGLFLYSESASGTSHSFLKCHTDADDIDGTNSTARLVIFGNGNVQNSNNSYGGFSDERLKENIEDSSSQWNDIKSVKVKKFSFKEESLDSANKIGVIAQDLESSGMNGLVETIDDVKSVKYSVLYMKAVKALQEAMNRIETLEAKVTALESE